jgi:DNA (cytosine-5)-methyltransferase 1
LAERLYRIGELFAGGGGLGLGAHLANVRGPHATLYRCEPVWANDRNRWAMQTYAHNLPGQTICADVRELQMEALPPIDGLLFGFPCNDFSVVGENKGLEGSYGGLYRHGIRALLTHRPSWFLAENVSGLERANEGRAFLQILRELQEEAGYQITAHRYRFEEYGVPQTRHRIIVVGLRRDLGLRFAVPAPSHGPGRRPYVTAREALAGVERVTLNNEPLKVSGKVREFLSCIPAGENAWYEGIPPELRLHVKGARMSHIYRRLYPDRPAHTVTARGGGGTRGYHWEEPRPLTNRELARLQTFPDDYHFLGPSQEVRSQIGMAVPPLGAKVIIEAILKTLAGVPYDSLLEPTYSQIQTRLPL